MLFLDRTFSSIDDIVKAYPFSCLIYQFYKYLYLGNSNIYEKIKNLKIPIIIASDPRDTIVLELGSIKTKISMETVKELNNNKSILESALGIERFSFMNAIIKIIIDFRVYDKEIQLIEKALLKNVNESVEIVADKSPLNKVQTLLEAN